MSTPTKKTAAARPGSPDRAAGVRSAATDADALPSPEAVEEALAPVRAFMTNPTFTRVRGFFDRLSHTPPQVLLLEGGNAQSRLAAAHYWTALLNCDGTPVLRSAPSSSLPGLPGLPPTGARIADGQPATDRGQLDAPGRRPCLACPTCIRMVTHLHRDCFFLDGTAGSIKIDDVRAMRAVLGEPPREAVYRVCVFREAQAIMEAAANALLKSFEEPRPATSFVLLAPQRERLLPTLVSRGFTLTLPWPNTDGTGDTEVGGDACPGGSSPDPAGTDRAFIDRNGGPASSDDDLVPWEAAIVSFLRTGRGFFEKSAAKGAVDAPLVHAISGLCSRALLKRLRSGPGAASAEGLESVLALLPETRLRMLDEALAECQESLLYGVNPVLVLEWLVTRMYFLVSRKH